MKKLSGLILILFLIIFINNICQSQTNPQLLYNDEASNVEFSNGWNVWRSNIHNQIEHDINLDSAILGSSCFYSFVVDKNGNISNISVKCSNENMNNNIKDNLEAVIKNLNQNPILKFPENTKRNSVVFQSNFIAATKSKYTTPNYYSDYEKRVGSIEEKSFSPKKRSDLSYSFNNAYNKWKEDIQNEIIKNIDYKTHANLMFSYVFNISDTGKINDIKVYCVNRKVYNYLKDKDIESEIEKIKKAIEKLEGNQIITRPNIPYEMKSYSVSGVIYYNQKKNLH